MKIYLAGDTYTNWQQEVKDSFCYSNHIFYDPSIIKLDGSYEYTLWDIDKIKKCDILFAYLHPNNIKKQLFAEIGYADALDKYIIFVDGVTEGRFDFIYELCHIVVFNMDEGIGALDTALYILGD